ncbi:SDR family NAD(P)-dependent oxidoreductase [Streptomyces sp. DSM 41524]|uniref:SDR family NAD(P)-dependent oxidoreductase n=1 Tax=Streptomyces asiaticus subsp. ignotus TaxID=3098222 RepID=A0ABU7QAF2_9ACTN|nr:SDR family NAD(P)-dependent oxidoreductase [Streptomyces sp. DSM 41524]MEE4598348.1 SDR family NAD(P)-dependent oxidoreductase [Streptomyces sp. DSM 41524]
MANDIEAPQGLALVTGANRGIGKETAAQLGAAGYHVLVGARDAVAGEQAAKELRDRGIAASPLTLSVNDAESVAAAAHAVRTQFGRLDLLVNNAGIHFDYWQDATNADLKVVREALEINLLGVWQVTQAMLPLLRVSDRPRIVNVSTEKASNALFDGGTPAYRVSKTAMNVLTRLFAAELAEAGIVVHAASPGWTATDMGGEGGRPVADGAASVVHAALHLGPDDGTGGYYQDGKPLPW